MAGIFLTGNALELSHEFQLSQVRFLHVGPVVNCVQSVYSQRLSLLQIILEVGISDATESRILLFVQISGEPKFIGCGSRFHISLSFLLLRPILLFLERNVVDRSFLIFPILLVVFKIHILTSDLMDVELSIAVLTNQPPLLVNFLILISELKKSIAGFRLQNISQTRIALLVLFYFLMDATFSFLNLVDFSIQLIDLLT